MKVSMFSDDTSGSFISSSHRMEIGGFTARKSTREMTFWQQTVHSLLTLG